MADHQTVLFASFDTSKFRDPESNYSDYTASSPVPITSAIINAKPSTLNFSISSKALSGTCTLSGFPFTLPFPLGGAGVDRITSCELPTINFTTNGIDGFGAAIDTFTIPKINFTNQKIYFIARFKDDVVPFKREPLIQQEFDLLVSHNTFDSIRIFNTQSDSIIVDDGKLHLALVTDDGTVLGDVPSTQGYVDFESNFNITSTGGGYFKGLLTSTLTGENFKIRLLYRSETFSHTFTAYSSPFNIYSQDGIYDIRKVNEDNDQAFNYKSLIYQDVLLNKPGFFDNLLGQVVGSKNSSTDTLGIKTFEKASNFVSNIADIDYCNVKALLSMLDSMNIEYEEYSQLFPPTTRRLVDILSVSFSKQREHLNQFQLNFDDNGFTSKTVFGKNKGEQLPIESTLLHTGSQSKYIIAYEKFSEKYTLVNTNILSAMDVNYTSPDTYPLSSYNESWGWGLVVPRGIDGVDVESYYEFYDYDNTVDGTVLSDFIDYTNSNCTYLQSVSSYDEIVGKDGIADNLLQYNIYSNCGLIDTSKEMVSGYETP